MDERVINSLVDYLKSGKWKDAINQQVLALLKENPNALDFAFPRLSDFIKGAVYAIKPYSELTAIQKEEVAIWDDDNVFDKLYVEDVSGDSDGSDIHKTIHDSIIDIYTDIDLESGFVEEISEGQTIYDIDKDGFFRALLQFGLDIKCFKQKDVAELLIPKASESKVPEYVSAVNSYILGEISTFDNDEIEQYFAGITDFVDVSLNDFLIILDGDCHVPGLAYPTFYTEKLLKDGDWLDNASEEVQNAARKSYLKEFSEVKEIAVQEEKSNCTAWARVGITIHDTAEARETLKNSNGWDQFMKTENFIKLLQSGVIVLDGDSYFVPDDSSCLNDLEKFIHQKTNIEVEK